MQGTDTATQQDVAIITKVDPSQDLTRNTGSVPIPIAGTGCGASTAGTTGVSKNLIAKFNLGGGNVVTLIAAHFKSGGTADDCAQREGQATVLRSGMTAGETTIFLGDFNDWDGTFTDAKGNPSGASSNTLSILKGSTHYNTGKDLAVADRWSSGVGLIDHILIPSANTSNIVSIATDRSGYPTTSSALIAGFYSDHYPLMLLLKTSSSAAMIVPMFFFTVFSFLFSLSVF